MILSNDNNHDKRKQQELKMNEYKTVEKPLLDQLENADGLKWEVLRLQMKQDPGESFRTAFSEVILPPKLEGALRKINPFLTNAQVEECVRKMTTFHKSSLLENNKQVLNYLLGNTIVSRNEETGELSPTVRFIDFENLEKNSFIAISQFKVKIPGTDNHIIPDVVLFVNGLPLVVIECKSPKVKEPIAEAIDQMMRYSEQRDITREGNKELFYYNQILVATYRLDAKFGTITTHNEKHFYRWSDPYPRKIDDLDHSEHTTAHYQQRLVAGMFDKTNLLDLIRTFTIFSTNDKGQTIKIVGRYQQFRAVHKTVNRLLEGKTKEERSGIIWHTQGSGKSLTMMFMVRKMRQHIQLLPWKIVFITDRTQLEEQLHETSQSIGFSVKQADSIAKLKELLKADVPDLVMGMIHKFQERDLKSIFEELNPSEKILTMTDEAHRSQYTILGANLDRAIPYASRIAYTGTPIDKTEETYGGYIDSYTMRQAIEDGVTLDIEYEGRTHNAEIPDKEGMDTQFADVFSDYNIAERLQILGYGSKLAYLEAEKTIKAKAADIVEHYVGGIFTNGHKAQVVGCSREGAYRYQKYIKQALTAKIAALEENNPLQVNLERLRQLETAVVISHKNSDPPHLKALTQKADHKKHIKRFKMDFDAEENGLNGNVGVIIVNNMLLTGFDAPVSQVLYLDKVITAHNLLQAIARVNRVGPEFKEVGYVVDYVGIGHHLKRALDKYDEKDINEILDTLKKREEAITELKDAREKLWTFLKEYGCEDIAEPDVFYDLFYDEDIRYEYISLFHKLTSAFNNLLPNKEALEYFGEYQGFLEINELASAHFRDARLSMTGIPQKLRGIADEYLSSKGIEQKIEPISILDKDFEKQVGKRKRPKTKAAEVEHAIRHYIDLNMDEDPELFASFAEELERIMQEFKDNWDRIFIELEKLRKKMVKTEERETYGLHRKTQMPIFRMIKASIFNDKELSEDEIATNVDLTQNIHNLLELELQMGNFWNSIPAQSKLRTALQELLLSERFIDLLPGIAGKYKDLITRIMEWARANNKLLTERP